MPSAPNPHIYSFDPAIPLPDVLAELAAFPSDLRDVLAGASPQVLTRTAPGSWSAFQTLCHARDAALIYTIRFRWMVFDDDPFLPNYDENNWVAAAKDTPADVPDILDQIAASRADLIRVLTRLGEPEWQRTGRHEVAGSIVLEHYVRHQAVHEAMHLEQIHDALGAR